MSKVLGTMSEDAIFLSEVTELMGTISTSSVFPVDVTQDGECDCHGPRNKTKNDSFDVLSNVEPELILESCLCPNHYWGMVTNPLEILEIEEEMDKEVDDEKLKESDVPSFMDWLRKFAQERELTIIQLPEDFSEPVLPAQESMHRTLQLKSTTNGAVFKKKATLRLSVDHVTKAKLRKKALASKKRLKSNKRQTIRKAQVEVIPERIIKKKKTKILYLLPKQKR